MIPATQPYIAWFGDISFPVIAWDDEGTPMVAPHKRLIRADNVSDFDSVEPANRKHVLPGQGWTITWHKDDPSKRFTEPVLGWVVDDDGDGRPLSACGGGYVNVVESFAEVLVLPPGVDPEKFLADEANREAAR